MSIEFIAGPVTILFGILVFIFSRPLMRVIRRGIERIYGNEVAEIFTDASREKWAAKVAGIAFIMMGALSMLRALP